jgi:hypothetical protein
MKFYKGRYKPEVTSLTSEKLKQLEGSWGRSFKPPNNRVQVESTHCVRLERYVEPPWWTTGRARTKVLKVVLNRELESTLESVDFQKADWTSYLAVLNRELESLLEPQMSGWS